MATDSRRLPLGDLNSLRERAVRLRLSGRSLAEIKTLTGLSVPTVISAHRAFLQGGWAAVAVSRRGRHVGDGRTLAGDQEAEVLRLMATTAPDTLGLPYSLWQIEAVQALITRRFSIVLPERTAARYLRRWGFNVPRPLARLELLGGSLARWGHSVYGDIRRRAETADGEVHWVDEACVVSKVGAGEGINVMRAVTPRGKLRWLAYQGRLRAPVLIDFFDRLLADTERQLFVVLDGMHWQRAAAFADWMKERPDRILAFHLPEARDLPLPSFGKRDACPAASQERSGNRETDATPDCSLEGQLKHLMAHFDANSSKYALRRSKGEVKNVNLTHLQRLEAESIHIMREVVAEADNPVMLYSIGKDSAVMLHLARKAFYPAVPPFPLLHVDTRWKFREMYEFRDRMAKESGMDLLVHINPEGVEKNINPFTHGSAIHTDVMKTEGLKQALDKYGFDAAFGGARRDEEKSRAKERVFSFRSAQHRWDPKNQRPELWNLYNARKHKDESIRVFPLSNWTELDIWQYIYLENVPIVPLYFAAKRPVVERDGALIMVDDKRMPLKPGEVPMMRMVRFRTLGCYPLTGAVESEAATLPEIIQEMLLTRTSERQGRVIDHDSAASMEKKKQEGYF